MKTILNTALFSVLLLFASCSEEKNKNTSAIETENNSSKVEKPESSPNADYSLLYALDNHCKMTVNEVANLFGVSTDKVKEDYISKGNTTSGSFCKYSVETDDGTVIFSVIAGQKSIGDVKKETEQWQTGDYEKKSLKMSSGNQFMWYHPNQGWLLLQHPDYANCIKITFKNQSKDAPKTTLVNIGQKAVDFLETKYKK